MLFVTLLSQSLIGLKSMIALWVTFMGFISWVIAGLIVHSDYEPAVEDWDLRGWEDVIFYEPSENDTLVQFVQPETVKFTVSGYELAVALGLVNDTLEDEEPPTEPDYLSVPKPTCLPPMRKNTTVRVSAEEAVQVGDFFNNDTWPGLQQLSTGVKKVIKTKKSKTTFLTPWFTTKVS